MTSCIKIYGFRSMGMKLVEPQLPEFIQVNALDLNPDADSI